MENNTNEKKLIIERILMLIENYKIVKKINKNPFENKKPNDDDDNNLETFAISIDDLEKIKDLNVKDLNDLEEHLKRYFLEEPYIVIPAEEGKTKKR